MLLALILEGTPSKTTKSHIRPPMGRWENSTLICSSTDCSVPPSAEPFSVLRVSFFVHCMYMWGPLFPSPARGGLSDPPYCYPSRSARGKPFHSIPPSPLSISEPFGLPLATILKCTTHTHTPHKSRHGSGHAASQPNLDRYSQSSLGHPPHLQCSARPVCILYGLLHMSWVRVHPHPKLLRKNLLRRRQSWCLFSKGDRTIYIYIMKQHIIL